MFDHLFTAFRASTASKYSSDREKIKLHYTELRYKRLFETAQDGILILDAVTGKITDVNPFLENLVGYQSDELIGMTLWHVSIFKNIAGSKRAFAKLQTVGYARYMTVPLQTKDGRSIAVEWVSNAYFVGDEKVIQCNIRDITQRRQTEIAIQERTKALEEITKSQEDTKIAMLNIMEDLEMAKTIIEEKNAKDEAMLASIGEGLIAVDVQGKIMILNSSAEAMLGHKEKDLIGKDITYFHLENEEGNALPIGDRPTIIAMDTRKPLHGIYTVIRKDHSKLPIALTVTPIVLNGKIIGALDVFRDISREIEIDKAKSEFVSLASHQLRTPLGIIKWYLEALQNEQYIKKSPAIIRRYLQEISGSSERVLSLVRDLLSVSRIEQQQIKNNPELTDVKSVILKVVKQMRIIAKKKGVSFKLAVRPRSLSALYIDVLRLHEVIENLIGNAIAYTPAGGTVEVSVFEKKGNLIMHIKDTGIGISTADQKMLFTKFFRSERAIRLNPEGSGLGLYVVKAYLEGWGGTLQMKNNRKKGSIFTLCLPVRK